MPFDKKGGHHLNTQKAMASDKMPPRKPGAKESGVGDPMPGGADETDIGGDSTRTILTHHGDGSHSVMHHDGEETGPDELEAALEMIRAKHSMQTMDEGAPRHHMPEHAMMSGM